jgi:hypothetical protein
MLKLKVHSLPIDSLAAKRLSLLGSSEILDTRASLRLGHLSRSGRSSTEEPIGRPDNRTRCDLPSFTVFAKGLCRVIESVAFHEPCL